MMFIQQKNQQEHIRVSHLTAAYGDRMILKDISFSVKQGEIFIIMGTSGSGKSTLLRHMIGLSEPTSGDVYYNGKSFYQSKKAEQKQIMRSFGVLYQGGALWTSMTLAQNIALPLQEYTKLSQKQVQEIVSLKLALVGLAGYENLYPSELSGGMQKRAGLARAMSLDPEILFFDEPSAGLDPVTSHRLDELILEVRDSLGTTIVVVTHELASIFDIADNAIFLDSAKKTIAEQGNPKELVKSSKNADVRNFLTRGAHQNE